MEGWPHERISWSESRWRKLRESHGHLILATTLIKAKPQANDESRTNPVSFSSSPSSSTSQRVLPLSSILLLSVLNPKWRWPVQNAPKYACIAGFYIVFLLFRVLARLSVSCVRSFFLVESVYFLASFFPIFVQLAYRWFHPFSYIFGRKMYSKLRFHKTTCSFVEIPDEILR